ncbi:signal peptidase II [Bacteriovorax sp. Seq25_V]|uniref:signal peptidase II n=1 Tax=Bacteriovorax sp. Seq25_V TaxID=1201288 RepID=UPI00038A0969|nr:signal peptidase II [Bacteriovorax sp. Seq25_V]EQC43548.1 signal peptidase II [Bacteriovorax sp. Seq25_V]
MDRIWKMSLLIVGIILADQFSKGAIQSNFNLGESVNVIPGFFNLTYVRNPGVAFGMGGAFPDWIRLILFKVVPVGACFWFLYLIWDTRKKSLLQCLSFSMIFAGAVGNLIDRISMDFVVDMFDFYFKTYHFATFNVADASISIAAGIYLIDYFLEERKKKNESVA